MSRARNIKPGFYRDAALVELPIETRLLFPGLWMLADRAGRLEDKPKQIKMEIYPADSFDVNLLIQQLHDAGLVIRYEANGIRYIQIKNFDKHQNPHRDEKASTIPAPTEHDANTVQAPCKHDGNRADSLIPDSLSTDSYKKIEATADKSAQQKGSRLQKDWVLSKAQGEWALQERKDWTPAQVRSAADRFRDYWIGVAGAKGVKLDWDATWRNWVRSDTAKASPSAGPSVVSELHHCSVCGEGASKKIGTRWFCSDHDQYTALPAGLESLSTLYAGVAK